MRNAFRSSNGASHYSHYYSDGASFYNGDGFVPHSQPPAISLTLNPTADASSHARKGSARAAGVLPLTVKQACQAMQHPFDDTLSVYGVEINIVTLVGIVVDKEENTSDVSFVLDDGTGRVDVKCWVDGQEMHACKEILTVQNGGYVRVYGHLRVFQGKRSIVALSIRLIVDFNEVTFHFLESIFVHVYHSKLMGHIVAANLIATKHVQAPLVSPVYNGLVGAGGAISESFAQTSCYPVNAAGSTEACVKKVQSIFEEPYNLTLEAGLHVDDVFRWMNGFGRQPVRDAIEFLVNEGMIYSTIDDDHYRSTSG